MFAFRECLLDRLSATRTPLRRATWIHCDEVLSSFFRFESKTSNELSPRCIVDRFRQVTVEGLDHPPDVEVFVSDEIVVLEKSLRSLSSVVETLIADVSVSFGYQHTSTSTRLAASLSSRKNSLPLSRHCF